MALSQVSICNLALDLCPAMSIVSMTERSHQANICARQYPVALDELLEMGGWTMARTRVALAEVTNTRDPEWAHAYALPASLALPIRVLPPLEPSDGQSFLTAGQTVAYPGEASPGAGMPFAEAAGVIYTNQAEAVLEYVSSDVSMALFTPSFIKALYMSLAAKIIMPIKSDATREARLIVMTRDAMEEALATSQNRNVVTYGDHIPETVRAVLG